MGTHGARGGAEVASGASNLVGDVLEVAHLAAEGAVDAVAHGGTEGAAQALDRLGEFSHLLRHLTDALLLVRRALVLRLHELHEHGLELVDADGGGTSARQNCLRKREEETARARVGGASRRTIPRNKRGCVPVSSRSPSLRCAFPAACGGRGSTLSGEPNRAFPTDARASETERINIVQLMRNSSYRKSQ